MVYKDIHRKDILQPINSKIVKKKLLAFDIETYNKNKRFLIGDIYDGEEHKLFREKDMMKKYFIENKFANTYIVATNLQFDFTMLYGIEDLWKFDIIQSNGRFIMCKYKFNTDIDDNHYTNKFIDSLNFAGMSVETAGKLLGLKKIEHPKFLGEKPNTDDEWEELIRYNQRDTEITYKLMELLQEGFNKLGGNLKLTISSTALDIFKRKYLKEKMIKESVILNGTLINKRIFESYYGGRTECFARGMIGKGYSSKKTVTMYDISSLYPSVMRNEYPLPQSIKKIEYPDSKNFVFEGLSNVIIETGYMKIPFLPYRDKLLKKLIFPVGRWKATYTHLELRKALELGYRVRKINWQYIYTKSFIPFKDFVEDVYAKRMEYKKEENPLEYVMKITMNSLFGKFSSRKMSEVEFFNIQEMSEGEMLWYLKSKNTESYNDIGYNITEKICDENYVFPILSSYTTAYGRIEMYKYLQKYNVYYIDTDGIVSDDDIPTSNKLGEMKREYTIKKGIIIKPKMYQFNIDEKTITKMKGIPKPNPKYFDNVLHKKPIEYTKFMKLKESIKQKVYVNMIAQITKEIGLEDNKRIWRKRFSPIHYDNDSRPHYINDVTDKYKKIIHRLTYMEKVMKSKDDAYEQVKILLSRLNRKAKIKTFLDEENN